MRLDAPYGPCKVIALEAEPRIDNPHRPEQLLLQDDPNFLPDFAFDNLILDANLDLPDLSHNHSSQSSAMSPKTPREGSSDLVGGFSQLIIPSSGSGGGAVIGLGFLPSVDGRLSGLGRR